MRVVILAKLVESFRCTRVASNLFLCESLRTDLTDDGVRLTSVEISLLPNLSFQLFWRHFRRKWQFFGGKDTAQSTIVIEIERITIACDSRKVPTREIYNSKERNLSPSIFQRRRISRDGNEGGKGPALSGPISVYQQGLSAARIFTQIYRSVYSRSDTTDASASLERQFYAPPSGTR